MERRTELLLFVFLTFVIPAILVSIEVFLIKNVLLTVFAFIWMAFCIVVLLPSVKGDRTAS